MKLSITLLLLLGSTGILTKEFLKKVTTKSKKHRSKFYPPRILPKSENLEHFTSTLPPSKTGKFGFREIKELLYDKKMNNFEIKSTFSVMDKDKGKIIN